MSLLYQSRAALSIALLTLPNDSSKLLLIIGFEMFSSVFLHMILKRVRLQAYIMFKYTSVLTVS